MTDKTQPEALRLADELAQRWGENMACPELEAAAELRRLHAENERLSGLCDKWNSECDEFREDNKRLAALVEAQQHTRIAELEAELEAVGAGGGQALSAAPADQSELHAEALRLSEILIAMGQGSSPEPEELWADGYEPSDGDVYVHRAALVLAMLTASPTPPAEQQAAPKAAPGESDYSKKWDAELGRTAMRFVDRAGDVHPGIDDAETICAEFHKAMSEVIERMPHVQRMAAPQQEAQEPATVPYQKLPNEIDLILSDPDTELSTGAKRALLWMRTWVSVPLYTAPQPAPAPLSDDTKDAARYRWLREHEGADGLIRSDCRGLYLPQRDALDSAVDAFLFTTPSQRGEIAGDGKPCNNDHDPDCRWPDCRCRERERMAAAIAAQGDTP